MIIGIPKEIKNHEYRVAATPEIVKELTDNGHIVNIQTNAGAAINYSNNDYIKSGANICETAKEVYKSELILKVKEPIECEYDLLQNNQKLFCFFHMAANPELAKILIKKKIASFAYESVTDRDNNFPLLAPMSEVAGKAAAFQAAFFLQAAHSGNGTLLNGANGADPAKVLILGAGISGSAACQTALGAGADVTVLDINQARLEELKKQMEEYYPKNSLNIDISNSENIQKYSTKTDALIGCVLLPGKSTPKLISKDLIKQMKTGSVFIDVSIDQGGCSETSKITTHQNPTYVVDGVVHYCVANIPGAFAKTSTQALTQMTAPYINLLADVPSIKELMHINKNIINGLNTYNGFITDKVIADDLNTSLDYMPILEVLKNQKEKINS